MLINYIGSLDAMIATKLLCPVGVDEDRVQQWRERFDANADTRALTRMARELCVGDDPASLAALIGAARRHRSALGCSTQPAAP